MRVRNALAPSGHSVAEESNRSAEEWRQRLPLIHAQWPQLFIEQRSGIGGVAIEANAAARVEADIGVAADVLSPLHTLEQKRLGPLPAQRSECRDGCHRVGRQFPHHGDDVEVASKLVEIHWQAFTKSSF